MIGLSVVNPAALDSRRENGIGLILVVSSANRLGGTMTIENEAGTFSVFVLINLYADFLLPDSFDEFNMESGFFIHTEFPLFTQHGVRISLDRVEHRVE